MEDKEKLKKRYTYIRRHNGWCIFTTMLSVLLLLFIMCANALWSKGTIHLLLYSAIPLFLLVVSAAVHESLTGEEKNLLRRYSLLLPQHEYRLEDISLSDDKYILKFDGREITLSCCMVNMHFERKDFPVPTIIFNESDKFLSQHRYVPKDLDICNVNIYISSKSV